MGILPEPLFGPRTKVTLCPEATKPRGSAPWPYTYWSGALRVDGQPMVTSYGFNDWLTNPPGDAAMLVGQRPAKNFFRNIPFQTPAAFQCLPIVRIQAAVLI